MKQNLILWIGAFLVTFLIGYLSSVTSKYFPVSGTIGVEGNKVSYRFDKRHHADENYKAVVRSDVADLEGVVQWRMAGSKEWNSVTMVKDRDFLVGELPSIEPLKTIEYRIKVYYNGKDYLLPGEKPVSMYILGSVPSTITYLYYITLFGGLLLSTRTGLEFFRDKDRLRLFSLVTIIFFFLYTVAVTPIKTTFELDVLNKRVPYITELFNWQAVILLLLWITGMWNAFKAKQNRKLNILIISIFTLLVYLLV